MTLTTPAPAGAPDLAPVRRRLAAATPGPWDHDTSHPIMTTVTAGTWPVAIVGMGPEDLADEWEDGYLVPVQPARPAATTHDDAELIAHAPEDIHALLGEVDRLHDALTQISHLLEVTWTEDLPRRIADVLTDTLGEVWKL